MRFDRRELAEACGLLGFLFLGCFVGRILVEVFIAVRHWMEVAP